MCVCGAAAGINGLWLGWASAWVPMRTAQTSHPSTRSLQPPTPTAPQASCAPSVRAGPRAPEGEGTQEGQGTMQKQNRSYSVL